MYTYYALKAMRYSPPQSIAMMITALQIAQMIIGFAITIWVYQMYISNGQRECNVTMTNVRLSFGIYVSYFVLFAKFFHEAYLAGGTKKSKNLYKAVDSGIIKEHTNGKVKSN